MYFHCTKYLWDQIQNFCEKAWSQMQKQNKEDYDDDDDDDDVLMVMKKGASTDAADADDDVWATSAAI